VKQCVNLCKLWWVTASDYIKRYIYISNIYIINIINMCIYDIIYSYIINQDTVSSSYYKYKICIVKYPYRNGGLSSESFLLMQLLMDEFKFKYLTHPLQWLTQRRGVQSTSITIKQCDIPYFFYKLYNLNEVDFIVHILFYFNF